MFYYPQKPIRIYPESEVMKKLDNDHKYVAEIKKNGWRGLVEKRGASLKMYSRRNTIIPWPKTEMRSYFSGLQNDFFIDGELIDHRTKGIKGTYYAFDLISLDNKLVVSKPLSERRRMLEDLLPQMGWLIIPEWIYENKMDYYFKSIDGDENEGIVIKALDAKYTISMTSCTDVASWLKVKKPEKHWEING